ncbi:MAG: chemotaxis protein CheW [Rickettsiales bacterium]
MSGQLQAVDKSTAISVADVSRHGYVTVRVANQLFGIPVTNVQDVLRAQKIYVVPLAPKEIAGSINLRGRIVTVIDLRKRLGLPDFEAEAKVMHVVVESGGEPFSLMVDAVGDVLTLSPERVEKTPTNLRGIWREVATGVCRLDQELLLIVDIQAILTFS